MLEPGVSLVDRFPLLCHSALPTYTASSPASADHTLHPFPCCAFIRSALTSGMSLTLSPCKPAAKKKGVEEGGTIEQIEKVGGGVCGQR